LFYRNVKYYKVGGTTLVNDHTITAFGMEDLALDLSILAIVALTVTLIYYRRITST
jgi:hypothetical protein